MSEWSGDGRPVECMELRPHCESRLPLDTLGLLLVALRVSAQGVSVGGAGKGFGLACLGDRASGLKGQDFALYQLLPEAIL